MSTWMLSTVAQLPVPVPGWQTVTLVVSMLRVRSGAVVTMIGWTLGTFDCGTDVLVPEAGDGAAAPGALAPPGLLAGAAPPDVEEAGVLPPLPPPPQPASAAQTRSRALT
ncbi:MAG TPA: hypothetical protein VEN30_13615 [Paraburkholderia sp.]|nr:hypothetical protein [Paraburkholderia sp.]